MSLIRFKDTFWRIQLSGKDRCITRVGGGLIGPPSRATPSRSPPSLEAHLLGALCFPGDDIEKHIRVLSGGERSRLVLAQMLYDPPNFLVLDEPTNHLDLETKEMLVKTLSALDGTMLILSHDRAFLRGLATRVLDLSGGGEGIAKRPLVFSGDYERWVERTGHETPGVHR